MSDRNVEIVRGLQPAPDVDLAAVFRDDATASALSEAIASLFAPDLKVVASTNLEQFSRRGLDGLRELWLDWMAPWQSYRTEIEDVKDLGDDVLVLTRDYGIREGMEAEVRVLGAAVWTLADGQVTRIFFYSDRAEALKAAGLSKGSLRTKSGYLS